MLAITAGALALPAPSREARPPRGTQPCRTDAECAERAKLEDLLRRAAQRDERAFATLYDLTSRRLFGLARRLLRRDDLAEEVLQDTFVRIWNHAGDYAPDRAAPLTWMSSILRNRAIDVIRQPARETTFRFDAGDPLDAGLDGLPSEEPGPEALASRTQEGRRLAQQLSTLAGHEREAIQLAFVEGLTHPEVAETLGVPLGTAKTWIRRGLERLRKHYPVEPAR